MSVSFLLMNTKWPGVRISDPFDNVMLRTLVKLSASECVILTSIISYLYSPDSKSMISI